MIVISYFCLSFCIYRRKDNGYNRIMGKGKTAVRAKKKLIKRKLQLGDNEKEILRMVGFGVLALSSLVLPNLSVALKPLIDRRGQDGINKLILKLIGKKVIDLGGDKITLTAKGKKLLEEIKIRDIDINRSKEWDGLWHLVGYDVPNQFNRQRDIFRYTLKRWGFYQIQKSLWAFPYECSQEIAILADYLNIAEYVILMNTDYLPNEDQIEKIFNL